MTRPSGLFNMPLARAVSMRRRTSSSSSGGTSNLVCTSHFPVSSRERLVWPSAWAFVVPMSAKLDDCSSRSLVVAGVDVSDVSYRAIR